MTNDSEGRSEGGISARDDYDLCGKRIHAFYMTGSYVGLMAALAAETFTRSSILPFWWSVWGATFAVIAVGVWLMRRLIPRLL